MATITAVCKAVLAINQHTDFFSFAVAIDVDAAVVCCARGGSAADALDPVVAALLPGPYGEHHLVFGCIWHCTVMI